MKMQRLLLVFLSLLVGWVASTSLAAADSKGLIRAEAITHQNSKNVAIVVGVEQYDQASTGLSPLQYAADDAVKLGTVFAQNRYVVKRLVNHQAGKHQILSTIRGAAKLIDPQNSTLVFSFSGHGFARNGKNYLMAAGSTISDLESSALKLDDVINALRQSRAKRILLFIDACRNIPGQKSISRGFASQNGQGVQILYSTKFGSLSWESPKLQQGVFSHFLVKGIQGAASADDNIIDFSELAKYVEGSVSDWSFQHLPEPQQPFRGSVGEVYGQFVVAAKGRIAPDNGGQDRQRKQREQQLAQQRLQQQRQRDQGLAQERLQAQRQREHQQRLQQQQAEQQRRQQLALQAQQQRQNQQQAQSRQSFEPEMVKISGRNYSMGKYEVTFAQWDACVNAGGCSHKPGDEGWGRGKRPVINVSWNDVQGYIRWLNQKTGKQYRLPTEQEWEHAARAGSKTDYPWGDSISCEQADYWPDWPNGQSCHGSGTSDVGSFSANNWGLHDTVGNVLEWTSSEGYSSGVRVLRGGSWTNSPWFVRSANRNDRQPSYRNNFIGFRLSRTP